MSRHFHLLVIALLILVSETAGVVSPASGQVQSHIHGGGWCDTGLPPTRGGYYQPGKWPSGLVYFEYDPNLTQEQINNVAAVMVWIEGLSDVLFIQRSNEPNWIYITEHPDQGMNNSKLGMVGGRQKLRIGSWGMHGIIFHEFMHALGFVHEQQREDRDDSVIIHWDNIPWSSKNQFDKCDDCINVVEYDFLSIMHYWPCQFSDCGQSCDRADENCRTMSPLSGEDSELFLMGNQWWPTTRDVQTLQAAYQGADTVPPSDIRLVSLWNSAENGWDSPIAQGQTLSGTVAIGAREFSDNQFINQAWLLLGGEVVAGPVQGQYVEDILDALQLDGSLYDEVNANHETEEMQRPLFVELDTTALPDGGPYELQVKLADPEGQFALSNPIEIYIEHVDNDPPTLAFYDPADGDTVSGNVIIRTAASDNFGVTLLEFYAGLDLIGTISHPADGQPQTIIWDSTPYIGTDVPLAVIAWDEAQNSTIEFHTVTVVEPSVDLTVELVILPEQVPVDGESSATVTAYVTDSLGQPVEGEQVNFAKHAGTFGVWVDAFGNQLSGPNDGLTDSLGRRVTYFRPTQEQTCYLAASIDGWSDTASFQAVLPSDITILISTELNARGNGWAEYIVQANFSTTGGPLDHGTAEFTTDIGHWTNGEQVDTDDIDTFGEASRRLTVYQDGVVNLIVCHLESETCKSEAVSVTVTMPPLIESSFELRGPNNARLDILAGASNKLVALEYDRGLALWDMTTWTMTKYWASSDFSGDKNDWDRSTIIGISANGRKAVVAGWEDVGIFDTQTLTAVIADDPSGFPEEDLDVAPDASRWVGIEDLLGDRVSWYNMSGFRGGTIEQLASDSNGIGIAYSPTGDRIAYTYRRGDNQDGYLSIWSAPGWGHLKTIKINSGARPGGVCWSPDGNTVAAANSEGQLSLFDKNGNQPRAIPINNEAGSVVWSPNGQYIAAQIASAPISIFDATTGFEVAQCNRSGISERDTDTLAWRADSQVLVSSVEGSSVIKVFVPFDAGEPVVDILSPIGGHITEQGTITLDGTALDDVELHPVLGAEWRIDSGSWQPLAVVGDQFQTDVTLSYGLHLIEVRATDLAGKVGSDAVYVERADPAEIEVWLDAQELTDGDTTPIEFGQAEQGESGPIRVFTVKNTGDLPLSLGALTIDPTDGFVFTEDLPDELLAGQTEAFTVRLTTDNDGVFSSQIALENGDADENPFDIAVIGEVLPDCYADCNGDGTANTQDFICFLDLWAASDLEADCDENGMVDTRDFICFLGLWADGC